MQNAGKKVPQGVLPEQHENVSHGDILLPVNSYHCIVPDTYTELSLHWHEEMEITLIREGMSDYRVGQEAFRASSGDLILVPPVTLHSAMELPGEIMVSDSLVFHLDYLGASGQDLSASAYLRPLLHGHLKTAVRICENDPDYEAIRDTFLLAHRCFTNREKFYELHLKDLLLRLLYLLFSAGYVSDRKAVPATRFAPRIFGELFHELFPAFCRHELHPVHQRSPHPEGSGGAGEHSPTRHGDRHGQRL